VDWDRVAQPRSGQEAEVVGRFVDAYEGGDVGGLVALLTQDARVTMPPDPYEFSGWRAVADHVRQTVGFWGQGLRLVPTRANHQPALGYYLPDPGAGGHRAGGLLVLAVSHGFMGWDMPWYSAQDSLASLLSPPRRPGRMHLVCYLRDGDRVFETYWTTLRGVEAMDNSYALMDLTVYGRQEKWEDSPPGWPPGTPTTSPPGPEPSGARTWAGWEVRSPGPVPGPGGARSQTAVTLSR
jgi:Bacterial protein of unknown function (DUF899)